MCSGVPGTPGADTHSTSEYAPSGLPSIKVISLPGNRTVVPSPGRSTRLPLSIVVVLPPACPAAIYQPTTRLYPSEGANGTPNASPAGQTAHHEVRQRNVDESLACRTQPLIVLTHPAILA